MLYSENCPTGGCIICFTTRVEDYKTIRLRTTTKGVFNSFQFSSNIPYNSYILPIAKLNNYFINFSLSHY